MTTVLVVEHDANMRDWYQRELTAAGYHVWAVGSGRAAVSLTRKERPDIVVLDMQLSDMDGADTLCALLDVEPTLPVIVYSEDSYYKSNLMEWIADRYLVQSTDLRPLKREIERLVDGRGQPSAEEPVPPTTRDVR